MTKKVININDQSNNTYKNKFKFKSNLVYNSCIDILRSSFCHFSNASISIIVIFKNYTLYCFIEIDKPQLDDASELDLTNLTMPS